MTTNPFSNAAVALLYIICVVSVINVGSHLVSQQPDNILMPIGMLSLFVLSAAIMAYIFLYQPIIMLIDGRRKEAVRLFLRTIAVFAGIAIIILLASVTIFR